MQVNNLFVALPVTGVWMAIRWLETTVQVRWLPKNLLKLV
jgi:hypothetical protein